jgi:hypothetical protein
VAAYASSVNRTRKLKSGGDIGDVFALPHSVAPYVHYISLLEPRGSRSPQDMKDYLAATFLSLLDRVISDLRRLDLEAPGAKAAADADGYETPMTGSEYPQKPPSKLSGLSYNLILGTTYMLVVPRKAEIASLGVDDGGNEISVSINSLGFVGLVLAREQKQRVALQRLGVREALRRVTWEAVLEEEETL